MIVWLLQERERDVTHGVFSSPQAAVDWLRKSRRFMHESGGPVVLMPDGSLNERFWLREYTLDPSPIAEYDMTPMAGSVPA